MGAIDSAVYQNTATPRSIGREPIEAVGIARDLEIGSGFHFDRKWLDVSGGTKDLGTEDARKRASYLAGRITADAKKLGYGIATKQVISSEMDWDGFMILRIES
tara:strand:- start:9211 stop:9522 length:312 start_codon:yes stop_codon:yes gene_type:complete